MVAPTVPLVRWRHRLRRTLRAIALERPLLLKGEPGCGKTKLARAVAYKLGLPYEAWYIKSTSRARDGLYIYDAVGRLRDAQLAASKIDNEAAERWDGTTAGEIARLVPMFDISRQGLDNAIAKRCCFQQIAILRGRGNITQLK